MEKTKKKPAGAIGMLIVSQIFSFFGTLIVSTSIIVLSIMSLPATVLSNFLTTGFERKHRKEVSSVGIEI